MPTDRLFIIDSTVHVASLSSAADPIGLAIGFPGQTLQFCWVHVFFFFFFFHAQKAGV